MDKKLIEFGFYKTSPFLWLGACQNCENILTLPHNGIIDVYWAAKEVELPGCVYHNQD